MYNGYAYKKFNRLASIDAILALAEYPYLKKNPTPLKHFNIHLPMFTSSSLLPYRSVALYTYWYESRGPRLF